MSYCTNCGVQLVNDDNFCPNCGQPIDKRISEDMASPDDTFNQNQFIQESSNPQPSSNPNINPNSALEQTQTAGENQKAAPGSGFTNEIFRKVEEDPDKWVVSQGTAKVFHIISWVCAVLAFFTLLEIFAALIGYSLARVAMQSGVNANAARWANLVLIVFYVLIYIFFFMVGFFGYY